MKRLIVLVLVIACCVVQAQIPRFRMYRPPVSTGITVFDSAKTSNSAASPFTLSLNCPAAAFVAVYISTYYPTTGENSAAVTIGGTPATSAYTYTTGEDRFESWYLPNVSTGSQTISITKTNATAEYSVVAASFSGVRTVTPIRIEDHQTGNSDDPTATTNTGKVGDLVIQGQRTYNVTSVPAEGETFNVSNYLEATMSSTWLISKAGAASVSIDPTVSGSTGYHRIAYPLIPVGEAITYTPQVEVIGVGTQGNADGANITPTIHASTTTGDLMLLLVSQRDRVASSAPVGWTLKDTTAVSALSKLGVWYKYHDGSEVDPVVTHGSGSSICGYVLTLRNVKATDPFDVYGAYVNQNSDPGPNTYTTTEVTTVSDTCLVVHLLGSVDNNAWETPVGAADSLIATYANGQGTDNSIAIASGRKLAKGATGTAALTQGSLGWDNGISVMFAIAKAR